MKFFDGVESPCVRVIRLRYSVIHLRDPVNDLNVEKVASMVGFPRPLKMQVMKVTAHKKHERALLNALQTTNAVELIDFGWEQMYERTKPSAEEQETISLLRKLDELIEFLGIIAPPMFAPKERIRIIDQELDLVLSYGQNLVNLVSKIRDEWAELESQREDLEKTLKLAEIMAVVPEMFFEDVGEGSVVHITAGTMKFKDTQRLMWQLEAVTNEKYFFVEKYIGEGISFVVFAMPNELRSMVDHIISLLGFNTLVIPPELKGRAPEIITQTKKELETIQDKLKELESEKEILVQKYQKQLLAAHEALEMEEEKIEAKKKFRETEKDITLWAWVPVRDLENVTESVKEATNKNAMIQVREPDFPEESLPTRLENRTMVKPLEELTKSFGAPGYHELDPSIFMAFAFPIIFGIMFADVGHGFLFMLMGLGGIIGKKRGIPPVYRGMGDELKGYFKKGGWLLFFCGLCSILFGFIFGSFFGMEEFSWGAIHFEPLWFNPAWEKNSEHLLHAPGGPYRGISGTILMLELSIVVGMVHITLGLLLKLYVTAKEGKKLEVVCFPVMLLIYYYTGFVLVFTYGLNPINWMQMTDPTPLTFGLLPNFTPLIPSALLMFSGGFILPFLVMILVMAKQHGMEGISEVFDFALSLISHTLSYARILAINKVHGILSGLLLVYLPILTIGIEAHTALGVAHVGIVGLLVQNFIIMTLETLISFLQTLRLNWVEFFSKFYEGRGHLFKPFGSARRFTSNS